ncbi:16S rRNA (guanine(527)-N(7))-methyltransferase RsmG [Desulfovibrio litoralis]|uniref:Ribosomal RNA small subunit methyltransferase G n=1 Tax=Desulfovibrio litoralis DSM 11393 TaxID=1121455 RepID=A0A1M7S9V6_9BACT|nr:RsmG family class I SAM-dependent methyltransferase [Desulfovibrio litoralis]SHN55409.1 16S rRNA m(7)G-527 methyltransferase [Desulfovibrio litoralis DSM 11393]
MFKPNDNVDFSESVEIKELVDKNELDTLCKTFGFSLKAERLTALASYLNFLSAWNKVTNLVGKNNWQDMLSYLITDSFYLATFLSELQKQKILPTKQIETWDLGAGAGLPGIPLRMLWQDGTYYLIEPRTKRVLFMQAFLSACPLPSTFVFKGKAETFFKGRKADLILSRAFMPYPALLNLVKNQLKKNGIVIVLSNDPAGQSLEGWTLLSQFEYKILENKRYFWALSLN